MCFNNVVKTRKRFVTNFCLSTVLCSYIYAASSQLGLILRYEYYFGVYFLILRYEYYFGVYFLILRYWYYFGVYFLILRYWYYLECIS